jgi:hypothetical protein
MLLLLSTLIIVMAKKPPKPGRSKRAIFEITAFHDVTMDPSTSWFEAYDDGWQSNKRNRVDWSSGYLLDKPQGNPHFTIEYITGTGELRTLEVGPCVFSGVKIQSFNKNLKRPYFTIAFRGPDEERGEMYSISTGSSPSQTASTVVRMDYDPTGLGSWTVEITDAYLVDISDNDAQGILGLIEHVTFIVTRVEKV